MECQDCNIKPAAKGRKICLNCKNKRYEAKNPYMVAYHRLKGHAKSRGVPFTISFEYFVEFCIEIDYISKRGRSSKSLHIDRVEEDLGYIEGNLQGLENGDNTRKYKRWRQERDQEQSEFHTVTVKSENNDQNNTPF